MKTHQLCCIDPCVLLRLILECIRSKMKGLVLFSFALVCVNSLDQAIIEDMKTRVQEYGIECAESEKATPEDLEALMNNKAPVTHEGRCVIFCVSKKLNLMNEDGQPIIPDVEWLNKIKEDDSDLYGKIEVLYNQCKGKVESSDGCDAALELASCMKHEGEKAELDKFFF